MLYEQAFLVDITCPFLHLLLNVHIIINMKDIHIKTDEINNVTYYLADYKNYFHL